MEQILKESFAGCEMSKQAARVSRYATPLAVMLVTMGLIICQPASPVKELTIGLLAFSIVFNLAAVPFIARAKDPHFWIHIRVYVNLAVNVLIVYYLGGYWKPSWFLLALTPLATAIYDSRRMTLLSALGVGALLLLIEATRKLSSPIEWCEQAANVLFILLVSLLINELVASTRPQKT